VRKIEAIIIGVVFGGIGFVEILADEQEREVCV